MKTKYIVIIIAFVITGITLSQYAFHKITAHFEKLSNLTGEEILCQNYLSKKKLDLKVKVSEKYIDEENRGDKVIVIDLGDSDVDYLLTDDESGLFESIEAGDSIYKQSGSFEYILVNDFRRDTFVLNYGIPCTE